MFADDIIPILVSVLLGGLIGLERELHEKPAGFRTNILICLGATIFSVISIKAGVFYKCDTTRIAAQIVTGIGFLGAGAILRDGIKITGLTTAATIWIVSAVGMAVGFRYYPLAFVSTAMILLVQVLLVKIEQRIGKRHFILLIRCKPDMAVVETARRILLGAGVSIHSRKTNKLGDKFIVEFNLSAKAEGLSQACDSLAENPDIYDVES